MVPSTLLYADALEHLVAYYQGGTVDAEASDIRVAVQQAYRNLCYAHDWGFYRTLGHLNLVAAVDDGTITYTHSTKVVLFSTALSSTAQTWAKQGRIEIEGNIYPIKNYTDSTHVTLYDDKNPGADVAAGTEYTLFRTDYALPADFRGMYQPYGTSGQFPASFIHPNARLALERQTLVGGAALRWHLAADEDNPGGWCLSVEPYPTSATSLQFLYYRIPRRLKYTGQETGFASGTVSNSASGTTVTGVGTAFSAGMVGSVFRIGLDGTNAPTGQAGRYEYDEQRRIVSVTNTTSLEVYPAFDNAHTNCKFVVSDPVDIWHGMEEAFLRGIEYQLSIARRKNVPEMKGLYDLAVLRAQENDNMIKQRTYAGDDTAYRGPGYTVTLDT